MENKPAVRVNEDFTPTEVASLRDYKRNGIPGIQRYKEEDFFQWFNLYMSGKTYSEISKLTNTKKDIILYMSDKTRWHTKRMQYYADLSDHMIMKCQASKLETLNTVTTMVSALNQYFGNKFDKFLKTKDETIIEGLDTKLLSQYYKATESVDKIIGTSPSGDDDGQTIVNVNMLSGAKVTQTDKNTIDVEPSDSEQEAAVGEILKNLVNLKKTRAKEE